MGTSLFVRGSEGIKFDVGGAAILAEELKNTRSLSVVWNNAIHVEILQRTGCFSIEALIIKRQLRWIGHVIRMPENRLPRKLIYGELTSGPPVIAHVASKERGTDIRHSRKK